MRARRDWHEPRVRCIYLLVYKHGINDGIITQFQCSFHEDFQSVVLVRIIYEMQDTCDTTESTYIYTFFLSSYAQIETPHDMLRSNVSVVLLSRNQ